MTTQFDLDSFTDGYLTCLLWQSIDWDTGTPLDSEFGLDDMTQEALREAREDCKSFCEDNAALLEFASEEFDRDAAHLGHDFCLSRNGHGTGFWDRGMGETGDQLHKLSGPYGSQTLQSFGSGSLSVVNG